MKKLTLILIMLTGWFLMGGVHASAANETDSKFDVSIVKSDKQRGDTNRAWYDLKMNPGEKTTLTLSLTNRDSKAATFIVTAAQAETETNMVLTANRSISDVQSSVIPSLQLGSQILTVPTSKVTIAAGETKEITANVAMPSSKINGSWLGGIHLQKQVSASDQATNGYTNRFNYLTYVQLSNTDAVTKADLSLKKIDYQTKNKAGQLNIHLQNDQAGYVVDGSSTVTVHQKGQDTKLVNVKQNNQSIANGSIFTYQVPTESLKTGKTYVADITIHDNKNNITWHWTKEFKVSSMAQIGAWLGSSPVTKNYRWLWFLLLIPLLAWLIFIWLKKKRMVDVIEMVAGNQIERRISYGAYKQMLKEGIDVSLVKKQQDKSKNS